MIYYMTKIGSNLLHSRITGATSQPSRDADTNTEIISNEVTSVSLSGKQGTLRRKEK